MAGWFLKPGTPFNIIQVMCHVEMGGQVVRFQAFRYRIIILYSVYIYIYTYNTHVHTHTHTYIYIYIIIYVYIYIYIYPHILSTSGCIFTYLYHWWSSLSSRQRFCSTPFHPPPSRCWFPISKGRRLPLCRVGLVCEIRKPYEYDDRMMIIWWF